MDSSAPQIVVSDVADTETFGECNRFAAARAALEGFGVTGDKRIPKLSESVNQLIKTDIARIGRADNIGRALNLDL